MSQVSHNPINAEKPKFLEEVFDLEAIRHIIQIKNYRLQSELEVC